MMPDQELFSACETEVKGLHAFFVDWFGGRVERNQEVFARFSGVASDNFFLINPDGVMGDLAALSKRLEASYGSRADFKIWIKNCRLRYLTNDICLMTYEEWQDISGVVSTRFSSALLGRREGTPNGVEWLHVHETWLPGD